MQNKNTRPILLTIVAILTVVIIAIPLSLVFKKSKEDSKVSISNNTKKAAVETTEEEVTYTVAEPDPEPYEEPADPRVLMNENFSNENYNWTETIVAYEEDDKTQFVTVQINDNDSSDIATANIVVNYNNMTATCNMVYSIDNKTVSAEYECDVNGLVTNSIKIDNEEIEKDALLDYEKITSDIIYKVFH